VPKQPRRLFWGLPSNPPSQRPLRDSVLVYAVFAAIVVVFGIATGGSVGRTVGIAAIVFCAAVAWTAWRKRQQRR
jgi:hypothetical protein